MGSCVRCSDSFERHGEHGCEFELRASTRRVSDESLSHLWANMPFHCACGCMG